MGSFGQRLQREREMRGITLEEIAASTKIGTRSLRALEEEDFDQLPGGIFNKGFVRAYAKYLGIDEEQAVADYLAAVGEAEQPLPEPPEKAEAPPVERKSSAGAWFVVLAIVALAGYFGWRWYEERRAQQDAALEQSIPPPVKPPAAPTQTPPPASADTAVAPSDGSTTPELEAAAAPVDGILLEIRANKDSWLQYSVDDKPGPGFTILAAQTETIRAKKSVKLTIGNPAGVEVSLNGKPQPPLGPEGKPRTVVFTPEGLQR